MMKRLFHLRSPRVGSRFLDLPKRALIIGICVIGLTMGIGGRAFGITLDFSCIPGASLSFIGGASPYFEFKNLSGNSFQITVVPDGAAGDTVGLYGNIAGKFVIGTISGNSAPVSNPGILTITDKSGSPFTAQLDWVNIFTRGAIGGLNHQGTFNLTDINYTGSNPDLKDWKADRTLSVNFTFNQRMTLSQLTASGAKTSMAFSGHLSAVPTPSTVLLLGTGLMGIVGLRYRRRAKG